MRTIRTYLKSASPYSQSRNHVTPDAATKKPAKETADDWERRTWRERCHVDAEGRIFIPPMAFKNCLDEAAKYLGKQIAGKGKNTYTKHFTAGVLVVEPLVLPITKADIEGEWLYVPSDGKRGGGKRVWRCYPLIKSWEGWVEWMIFDDLITEDVLVEHLTEAGKFIGIGRFRPRNGGFYGRFGIEKVNADKVAA